MTGGAKRIVAIVRVKPATRQELIRKEDEFGLSHLLSVLDLLRKMKAADYRLESLPARGPGSGVSDLGRGRYNFGRPPPYRVENVPPMVDNDLDPGSRPLLRFTADSPRDEPDTVREIFSRRGAYARFEYLPERNGMLQQWYEHQRQARIGGHG